MALRLANAEVLPLDVEAYAAALRDFVRTLDDIPGRARRASTCSDSIDGSPGACARAGRRLNQRIEHGARVGALPTRRGATA